MSTSVVDQARDTSGQHLHQVLATYATPDFVKTALAQDPTRVLGTPDTPRALYADPVTRTWPCHTAEATLVSSLSFELQKTAVAAKQAEVIGTRLAAAARTHGIAGMIADAKTAAAPRGDDLTDADFGYVYVDPTTSLKTRLYPLRNPGEIKRAAEYALASNRVFAFADRRLMAERILQKAAAAGLRLDDEDRLTKTAGVGTCSAATAAGVLFARARRLREVGAAPDVQLAFAKAAKQVLDRPDQAHLPSNLRKIAAAVDEVDREHGFADFALPEEELFQITHKTAAAVRDAYVPTATGHRYTRTDLLKLSAARLGDVLGEEFAAAVTTGGGTFLDGEKLAAVVPTLPLPDARLFDRVAAEAGVQPVK